MKENDKAERALTGLLRRNLAGGVAAAGKDCPEAEILAAYFERSLPKTETGGWELHFSTCTRCQEQLAALARMETALSPDSIGAAAPASIWWRLRYWLAPAATAAAAVALWVAIHPAPPVEETAALHNEQQVAVPQAGPAAAAKGSEVPSQPSKTVGAQHAAPLQSLTDKDHAREERDARAPEKEKAKMRELDATTAAPASGLLARRALEPARKNQASATGRSAGEFGAKPQAAPTATADSKLEKSRQEAGLKDSREKKADQPAAVAGVRAADELKSLPQSAPARDAVAAKVAEEEAPQRGEIVRQDAGQAQAGQAQAARAQAILRAPLAERANRAPVAQAKPAEPPPAAMKKEAANEAALAEGGEQRLGAFAMSTGATGARAG